MGNMIYRLGEELKIRNYPLAGYTAMMTACLPSSPDPPQSALRGQNVATTFASSSHPAMPMIQVGPLAAPTSWGPAAAI
jgi:hypothetical protein